MPKHGVYICSGCEIGQALDIPKLAKLATGELKAQVCRTDSVLCSAEGVESIRQDLGAGTIDTAVIAGCSARFKAEAFNFNHGSVVERVNLREHVAWSHKPGDENTQELAEDYLRMGVTRALKTEPLKPLADEVSKKLLVIGGGVAGAAAAEEAAAAGYEVVLVERASALFAPRPDVTYNPRIQVFCGSEIEKIAGEPGKFDVTLRTGAGEQAVRVGAIVVATGWTPYDASKLSSLGYGQRSNVVTNVELEQTLAAAPVTARRILFIQCAGSRDKDHLPYCSSICCMSTLRQVARIREQNPDAEIYIVYRDMRTPGQDERIYREVQKHPLNFFTKGEVSKVEESGGILAVTVEKTPLGDAIVLTADLVVLATGMVPNGAEQILKLAYRQGPELPVLQDGFPDSHFVCFPYETRRTGIYAAGAARAPMGAEQARQDGMGAALKAIQCVELAAQGQAVHPRTGDASYPNFFLQRCTQCKRCTEECPFGALDEDAKGTPKPNPYRCRRCGVCMGACPERIISFANYSVDMISSMVKAIEVPEEDEEKPRVIAFICENDAYPAMDLAGMRRLEYDASVRVISLRCLGSLNVVWLADAFSRGIDGVMLIGCKYGDNYQCHFAKGSELASRRLTNVKETLDRLQLESERLQLTQLAMNEWDKLPALFNDFVERMRELGPNPYKGF